MAEITAALDAEDRARLDELFSDLEDHSTDVQPISEQERAGRRVRLGALLAERGSDAILFEGGTSLRYLTGVEWGRSERLFGLVVTADGGHFWVAPGFEEQRATLKTAAVRGEIVAWQEHEQAYAPLASALLERGCRTLLVDPWLRHRFVHGMQTVLGTDAVTIGLDVVIDLRGTKDDHELQLLRRANELTQQAICRVAETLEPGVTSTEIGRRLTVAQERLGLTDIWHLCLIGPAAAYPHGDGKEVTLASGDLLLVDSGGWLHGYGSDNTRTWTPTGKPSERETTIWHLVRDAQRAAFDALRPGVECGAVDRAARSVIEAGGFGPGYAAFRHRLGHGIGMDGHEDPYLDGGSQVVLAPGMTFSDEPGIYLSGELGLRIEDIVCVTQDGADHFGDWQAGPTAPHPA